MSAQVIPLDPRNSLALYPNFAHLCFPNPVARFDRSGVIVSPLYTWNNSLSAPVNLEALIELTYAWRQHYGTAKEETEARARPRTHFHVSTFILALFNGLNTCPY